MAWLLAAAIRMLTTDPGQLVSGMSMAGGARCRAVADTQPLSKVEVASIESLAFRARMALFRLRANDAEEQKPLSSSRPDDAKVNQLAYARARRRRPPCTGSHR